MRVSAVIPCRNAERWIGAALTSVASQRSGALEVLVVDDGSTDGSRRAVEASGVPVTLLSTPGVGGAGARNAAIRVASGELVAFLDADDVWYADHLERALQMLERGDAAYLAHYDLLRLDGTIEALPTIWPVGHPTSGLDAADFLRLFRGHPFFGMSSLVVRREVLLEVGLLDESQTRRHDLELFLRIVAGRTWSFDPRAAYAYRDATPGGLSGDLASRELFFLRALLRNLPALDGEDMRALVRLGARRAMSHAYTSGDTSDRRAAQALALPHLSPADRAFFAAASLCPPLFGLLNRARRRLTGPLPPP